MLTTSVVETNIKSESFLISGNFTVFNYSLFLFIFFANLSGMVPYAFTLTSHLSVTMLLSTTVFAGSTIISCRKYGWQFFSLFFPSGVPLVIALFLIFIETLSYIIRLFSLGIRLFANLMAGHTLIKILSLFS
jgi:ATP synthase subunit 6